MTTETDDIVEDRLLDGRVRLRQRRRGYRVGMDAALLAAEVPAMPGEAVLEVGCGVGGVLAALAVRRPGAVLTGLERDTAAADLARENLALNGLESRATIVTGSIADRPKPTPGAAFDWAVANPPFFDDPTRLRAPDPAKAGAWMADDGLGAWLRYLARSLREGGRLVMIHRADRLGDIFAGLGPGMGDVRVRPIHPRADEPASRVLVRATKAAKGPLVLLPPFVLHDAAGGHTEAADALWRGRAELGWNDGRRER